jgi:VanZ family protein
VRPGSRSAWLLFAGTVLGQLVLLYWPRAVGTGGVPHLDKAAHVVSFALVMATGVRVGLAAWLLAASLAVHAVASEVVQHTVLPGRSGDPADVLADLAGVAGVLLALGAASWRHERRARQQ